MQSFNCSLRRFRRLASSPRRWRHAGDLFIQQAVLGAQGGEAFDDLGGVVGVHRFRAYTAMTAGRGDRPGPLEPLEWSHECRDFPIPSRAPPAIHAWPSASSTSQAPAPPGRRGDRRLRHDRGRRQGHGLPVRRQGQLHPAGRAASAAEEGTGAVRAGGGEPGPETAGLPEHILPEYLAGLGVPYHHRAGHLLGGQPG